MSDQEVLRPFPGLVVHPDWADRVVSGPYDAYSPAQRAAMAAENPYSFLHVTRSQEDVPPEERDDIDALIDYCADSMDRLYDLGAYRSHDEPVLFLYRMGIDTPEGRHVQTGIMGLVPVTDVDDPRILRHEAVRPGRTDLLARHLLTVGSSSSPISLTYRSDGELEAAIARCCETPPVLDARHEGVEQTVWAVGGDDSASLIAAFGGRSLYVTDGHHRLAAAVDARSRVPERPDDGPLEWIQAVLFADEQMLVLPFHRRVGDSAGRRADELAEALGACGLLVPIEAADAARPQHPGSVGVYLGGGWYTLDLPLPAGDRAVDALDVSRLQDGILGPVFGVTDPGSDPMIDYVPDPVGMSELVNRCDEDNRVGFVLYPTSVTELMDVADDGDLMPPKSSYFEPKPRSGVFIRRLDRELSTPAAPGS
ncbi:MAG: DUF1015 domain-containing protein [Actinobacteria bacterium]|nr:DUF1015 domain-containing protein [Actinomycetota bacterium]